MQAITPGEARIVIVDHPSATGQRAVFDALVERLIAAGHAPARYASTEALATSGAARSADILVATSTFPLTAALLQACPRLRAVVCAVTGTEGFDIAAATERGILIANGQSPEENCESMAEATVMLMLALLYDLHGAEARLKHNQLRPMQTQARMLKGKRVGLIGFGAIAREVASRLAPWGVRLQATVRTARDLPYGVARVDLDTLLATSDIVSVHASLTDETRLMLDRTRLALLQDGAVFINTARGGIVDEATLAEIARAKHLRLAVDVFATKPLAADSPLRDLPDAILTPHMVGHTRELDESQVDAAYENVTRALSGRLPLYVRNPEATAAWRRRLAAETVPS